MNSNSTEHYRLKTKIAFQTVSIVSLGNKKLTKHRHRARKSNHKKIIKTNCIKVWTFGFVCTLIAAMRHGPRPFEVARPWAAQPLAPPTRRPPSVACAMHDAFVLPQCVVLWSLLSRDGDARQLHPLDLSGLRLGAPFAPVADLEVKVHCHGFVSGWVSEPTAKTRVDT